MCRALLLEVNSNNSLVEKDYPETIDVEHFDREIQKLIRGYEENYKAWGIAIDQNLEIGEEGIISITLVIIAIFVIILVVAINFRTFIDTALVALSIPMLLVWLWGISHLIGLKGSMFIDILLPIIILSLGVDYAIHSIHRYREERQKGKDPRDAIKESITRVGGALMLTTLTTAIAFLSNAVSELENVRGFGIASGIAIISAFFIMGIFVPAVKMVVDGQRFRDVERAKKERIRIGRFIRRISSKPAIVILIVLLISIPAFYGATRLEARLEVKQYFNHESDFVVSLDKLDEHFPKAGEPAIIYIKGDLSAPDALNAINQILNKMKGILQSQMLTTMASLTQRSRLNSAMISWLSMAFP